MEMSRGLSVILAQDEALEKGLHVRLVNRYGWSERRVFRSEEMLRRVLSNMEERFIVNSLAALLNSTKNRVESKRETKI
jgi:hypothetical protein